MPKQSRGFNLMGVSSESDDTSQYIQELLDSQQISYSECMTFESINHFFAHSPVVSIAVGLSAVIATLVYLMTFSGVIQKELKRRRMKHAVAHLKDHYIICGFGRVGQQVARELESEKEKFVILEREEAKMKAAKEENWPYVIGDVAVDESMLQQAQIENAKGVIIAVGSDADAIFMAISAKALKPDIFIVARASNTEAANKLSKIGVNRIALPYQIGGYHMATMAIRPSVVDFLDLLIDHERDELEMEEFWIEKDGFYDGKALKESEILADGVAILAIRRSNAKAVINPEDSTVLKGGDRLVAMGPRTALDKVTKMVEKHQPESKDDPHLAADINPIPFGEKAEK
jgi:voltage-gated potassium channel